MSEYIKQWVYMTIGFFVSLANVLVINKAYYLQPIDWFLLVFLFNLTNCGIFLFYIITSGINLLKWYKYANRR